MQSHISAQQSLGPDSISHLLDVVETRMIESISANATRVSKKSMGAVDAAAYHLGAGGQRVRAKIALQASIAVGLSAADAISIAAAVELMHNASLVHDDIQDADAMRRGQQAVWFRFGVNTAICTGDLLLSAAYATLCKLENSHALASMVLLVHECTAAAIDGQCADLAAGANSVGNDAGDAIHAITRYQQIAIAKSGALLSLPIELVLLASGHKKYLPDARRAAEAFSVCYQIVDDLHDVQSDTCAHAAQQAFNIISVFKAAGHADGSAEKAKQLGLEQIDLAIASAKRLPLHAGAQLTDYAYQLRDVLSARKLEALVGDS